MTVILVTGSARGLGRGAARELAARGASVHTVWRSSHELAPGLEDEFPARVHRADVTRGADCERLVRDVLERDGRLDVCVHAVGEYRAAPLSGTGPEDVRSLLASNLESAFHLTRAARPALRETGGSFIFFGCSGVESLRARRDAPAYVAAKTALLAFVRSLALEEAPFGVRANMVSPGLVPHEHASADTRDPALHARIPLGRPGEVAEVARAVCWLASEDAAYVTGQNLDVAGGWML